MYILVSRICYSKHILGYITLQSSKRNIQIRWFYQMKRAFSLKHISSTPAQDKITHICYLYLPNLSQKNDKEIVRIFTSVKCFLELTRSVIFMSCLFLLCKCTMYNRCTMLDDRSNNFLVTPKEKDYQRNWYLRNISIYH